jgi:ribonuclease R
VHLELTTCFKLLERSQGARDNAGVNGVHGGHGQSSGRGGGRVAREEEGSGESYGGGRPGSDAWGCREAGGGADRVATMASGGEERLGQTTGGVARRGEASAARGSGGAGLRRHMARL